MKKSTRKTLMILGFIIAVLCFYIAIMETKGARFNYKNLPGHFVEEDHWIVTDDWVFYYTDAYATVTVDGWGIYNHANFSVIKKNGFMYDWYFKEPEYVVYTADTDFPVGTLKRYKEKDVCHYIFFWGQSLIPDRFVNSWVNATSVTINGKEHDLFKRSFFTTSEEFSTFYIGDYEVKLVPYEEDTLIGGGRTGW